MMDFHGFPAVFYVFNRENSEVGISASTWEMTDWIPSQSSSHNMGLPPNNPVVMDDQNLV